MTTATVEHTAIRALTDLVNNEEKFSKPYFIFSVEDARIVMSFLRVTKVYGRDVVASFWDNSKERIAFKKDEGAFACKPNPSLTILAEHEDELARLMDEPIDASSEFYKQAIELVKNR